MAAAAPIFAERGWLGARMEDIANAAGVSAATAFNHFPTKYSLIGELYAPFVAAASNRANCALADGVGAMELLERHIRDLAKMSKTHLALTVPFVGAVQEYTVRVGGPPSRDDRNDPRVLAPVPETLIRLIQKGQEEQILRPYPTSQEIAVQLTNLLLLRALTRPSESADDTAELMLTILFGVLHPETLVAAGPDGRPFAVPRRRRKKASQ